MRQNNVKVSQGVANDISASFSKRKFNDALIDWRNHQSLRDAIVAEYHAYIPVVTAYLRDARSLIYVSFDNWTSTGGKLGLTSICVHIIDAHGVVQDFVLGLPELPRQHSGVNIASVIATTLTKFRVNKDSIGYFMLNNAYNNNTAVASLANLYGFGALERRLRCCCHILNLAAQNSYYAAFARAVELQGPLDSYVKIKIGKNRHAEATARRAQRPGVRELAPPRLFLREGGLNASN
ncbi:hypothetical protein L13192_12049 [Pyrenophora tritici-repentis]|nr:hypothetical protein L13192_12049 [Pyrenophora tritici-repentis]